MTTDNFDGFVILHGTDTMAYTASALSFMLENLAKPVIIPVRSCLSDLARGRKGKSDYFHRNSRRQASRRHRHRSRSMHLLRERTDAGTAGQAKSMPKNFNAFRPSTIPPWQKQASISDTTSTASVAPTLHGR